jgi:hypothetical protein
VTVGIKQLERRLRVLEDRAAIADLFTSFCRAVDRKDEDLFLSLWAKGARWKVGEPIGFAEGREELLANARRVWKVLPIGYHMVGNLKIDLDGALARTECDVTVRGADVGDRAVLVGGAYADDLARTKDGAWRIVEHRAVVHYWAPINDPWSLDPATHLKLPG